MLSNYEYNLNLFEVVQKGTKPKVRQGEKQFQRLVSQKGKQKK